MPGFLGRGAPGLAAGIVVAAVVAGCGQTSVNGTGGASRSPAAAGGAARVLGKSLCADQATVSQVRVARIPGVVQLEPGKPGQDRAFTITIADPLKVRELARAVCSLPARHAGTRCVMNIGGGYQLSFSAMSVHLPVVTIQSIGCQQLTGAGQARLATSPGFWAVFSRVTGIQAPAHGL